MSSLQAFSENCLTAQIARYITCCGGLFFEKHRDQNKTSCLEEGPVKDVGRCLYYKNHCRKKFVQGEKKRMIVKKELPYN